MLKRDEHDGKDGPAIIPIDEASLSQKQTTIVADSKSLQVTAECTNKEVGTVGLPNIKHLSICNWNA